MAARKNTARNRSDEVESDLRSISTTTGSTVAEVHELLGLKSEDASPKDDLTAKPAQRRALQSAKKTTSRTAATAGTTASQTASALTPRDRYVLATSIANTTLKALSDALKNPPSRTSPKLKPRAKADAQIPEQPNNQAQSLSQKREVSRETKPSTRKPPLRRSMSASSCITTGPDPGLVATAECARAAFAYLRTSEAAKFTGQDHSILQLEQGMLALVGKLVAHGLDSLAMKELRILKRRLNQSISQAAPNGDERPGRSKSAPKKASSSSEKETLASLLDFGEVGHENLAIPIVVSLQLYTLRLISRIRRPALVVEAWPCLSLSNPSSPANLVSYAAEGLFDSPKRIRQLESLAQIVLSLCPSNSRSEDASDGQTSLLPPPDVVFQLQHLSFKIRQRWWKLAGHRANEEKELQEPFLRCLATFTRRCKMPPVKKYRLAESLFHDLFGTPSGTKTAQSSTYSGLLSTAAKTLSSMAQSADLPGEALRWLDASGSVESSNESAAGKSIRLVRTAISALDLYLKEPRKTDPGPAILQALASLSQQMDGTLSELDSLFVQSNVLRRLGAKVLSLRIQNAQLLPHIQPDAMQIIASTVHFTARYLGKHADVSMEQHAQSHYKRKLLAVAKYVKSIVDSACLCSKCPIDSDFEDYWTIMNSLLHNCLAILRHFYDVPESTPGAVELQHPFARISNAYWAVHSQLKTVHKDADTPILAMQSSVDALLSSSQAEQKHGLLAMKAERLAETLDSAGQTRKSREANILCIKTLINFGALESASELAETLPVHRVFESDESTVALARSLKALHRSFLKSGITEASEYAFFDDIALPPSGRGLLLEWQLSLFLKALSRNRSWDADLNASVQKMSERLHNLYTPEQFPVRRLRLEILLLRLSQAADHLVDPETILSDVSEQPQNDLTASGDEGLSGYATHLKALRDLISCMREPSPSVDVIKDCCTAWQALVDSTSSGKELTDRIDDVDSWLEILQGAVDFLIAKGEEYASLPLLHLIVSVMQRKKPADPSSLVMAFCALGLQLLRLGYSGKAVEQLAKAEPIVSDKGTSTEAKLQWHLSYSEYLVETGNMAKCESTLSAAERIAQEDTQFMDLAKSSTTLSGRIKYNRILAYACYIHSILAINTGHHKDAARYAKQCVALNRRIWAGLESKPGAATLMASTMGDVKANGSGKGTIDPARPVQNDNGAPVIVSTTHEALDGPEFWHLTPPLYRGLMQQSQVFAHQGLLQEAVYAAEQAERIASAVKSTSLTVENSSRRAEYWAQGGKLDKAESALALDPADMCDKHVYMAGYYSSLARIYHLKADFEAELAVFDKLEGLIKELSSPAFLKRLDTSSTTVETLTEQMSTVSLVDPIPSAERQASRTTRGRKPAPKKTSKAAGTALRKAAPKAAQARSTPPESAAVECLSLQSLQADIARRRAFVNLLLENISAAFELLGQAQILEKGADGNLSHLWITFKAMLSQSMKQLASDFTFNSLPESTIAFPAVRSRERRSSGGTSVKRANITKELAVKSARARKATKGEFIQTLREARERLIESHRLCAQFGSSSTFQQASSALAHVTVLLSAVSNGELRGSLHPLYAAYMSEIPKRKALQLAQESIEIEQQNLSRVEYLAWPKVNAHEPFQLPDSSGFQKDDIDIIPDPWTVISLGLNEDHDELYITRYESGLSPFVLRLPMGRHTSRDMDEEEFSFEDGRTEFEEIIELSDFSTRTAKDMTTKAARLQWWEEREALDLKLRDLLVNIENIWLGGFRGIFSPRPREPALQARFRKTFETILDRHLPSRQAKATQKKTVLDARVLDLFIGLGDATDEEVDLDEPLMDLVYFVVDILQFNGETNAYDEIDFDAMVIETLDALREYHSASQGNPQDPTHTILILDKNLHIFPWESLPCLQSLAISRLPSLAALRERILAAKATMKTENARPGYHLAAEAGGTSVLNPSGDLTHTLKTLQPRLESMQGPWSRITNRPPSEEEFENALGTKDLVLYFGHGSGAQFVRPKTVRRLYAGANSERPGCATTLLFGCSSVHLTENGIYESSGMLASYLTAGAPAVVGMLWDVTDKDCDRVATRAGELWGLWPEVKNEEEGPGPGRKKKNKQAVSETDAGRATRGRSRGRKEGAKAGAGGGEQADEKEVGGRKRVALDEAISDAREACVLRYLNGAAAVVYGIPVYLD